MLSDMDSEIDVISITSTTEYHSNLINWKKRMTDIFEQRAMTYKDAL